MFYIIIISVANILIVLGNLIFSSNQSFLYLLLHSVYSTISVIAFDGITAFIIRCLPEKWFAADAKFFYVSNKEKKFYQKIKIKSWKSKIPELGGFSGFHKDKLRAPNDAEYLRRFLFESNYGVVIHFVNAVGGFIILLMPFMNSFSVAFPVAVVNFVLSLLPLFILRYNTPSLRALYQLKKRSAEKAASDK